MDKIKKFGPDNVRAELAGLWDHAPKEVVGLPLDRLINNCYCKEGGKKTASLQDEIINHGPPFDSSSKPKVITTL